MKISYDPRKRLETLAERGLDFEDAARMFDGRTFEFADLRQDYGEHRTICYGHAAGHMLVVVYTPRGDIRRIISMRKANEREKARFGPILEV
jgi:uncharacterized DUF497 family protein